MAKPAKQSKPRASEPVRRSGSKPASRSASSSGHASPKFYDGPTVASRSELKPDVKKYDSSIEKAQEKGMIKVKKQRSGWGVWSLVTLIPLLLFASLFSTVLCPPPSQQQSSFSRYALNSLGFNKANHASLHERLCYPANVYQREVLEPYVYPVLEDAQARVHAHPVYKERIEPGYNLARDSVLRVWNGPVKPVVNRIARGARKIHLTYVHPHLPYIRAKFTEATAPARLRVCALYKTHVAPHIGPIKKQACAFAKQAKLHYHSIANHPATAQAGQHARNAFKLGKHHTHRAYKFSRPHAIRAYDEGKRFTAQTLIPRTVQAIQVARREIARVLAIAKSHIVALYDKHAAEHVGPYLAKADAVVGPYIALARENVYTPYVAPVLTYFVPCLAEKQTKSFWTLIADKLPDVGAANAGDRGYNLYSDKTNGAGDKAKPKAEKKAKEAAQPKVKVEEKPKVKVEEKPKVKVEKTPKVKTEFKTKPAATTKAEQFKREPEPEVEEVVIAGEMPTVIEEATIATAVIPPEPTATADATSSSSITEEATAEITPTTVVEQSTTEALFSTQVSPPEPTVTADADAAVDPSDLKAEVVALKKKIDFQGRSGYSRLQDEMKKNNQDILDNLVEELKNIGVGNLDREIARMIEGLDKLYTRSTSLTPEQVAESLRMSDKKVGKVHKQVTSGVEIKKKHHLEKIKPAIAQAQRDVEKLVGPAYEALGKKLTLVDGADFGAYKALKKDVDTWKAKYAEIADKPPTQALKDQTSAVNNQIAELVNEFNEIYEGWRGRQEILRKNALDRIAARKAVASEESAKQKVMRKKSKTASSAASSSSSSTASANSGRVSILPVSDETANVADGDPVIGKAKEQVVDALSMADAAASAATQKVKKAAGQATGSAQASTRDEL